MKSCKQKTNKKQKRRNIYPLKDRKLYPLKFNLKQ